MNQRSKLFLALAIAICPCSNSAFAQQHTPIDMDDFNIAELPVNPLPGGPLPVKPLPATSQAPSHQPPSSMTSTRSSSGKLRSTSRRSFDQFRSTKDQSIVESASPTLHPEPTAPSAPAEQGDFVFNENHFDETSTTYNSVVESPVEQNIVQSADYDVHTVIGFSALGFRRNYGGDRLLSNNYTDRGDTLSTEEAEHNKIGGFETYMNCRSSSGVGWEFRYFGLAPSGNTAVLGNDPSTVLVGLNNVGASPTDPSVATIFADGNFHAVTRESGIYNFEFNFLKNRPDLGWFEGLFGNVETLVGLRYIDFDESLEYASGSDTGTGPRRVALNSSVENSLFGMQVGGRTEFTLYRRLSGTIGTKLGLFYNDAKANRRISGTFADGSTYQPSIVNGSTSITGYNFGSGDSEASFLGELDLGLIYQVGQSSRFRLGYRAIGLSGVTFASDSIPEDLANLNDLQSTSDGRGLRLRGSYFSYELAF